MTIVDYVEYLSVLISFGKPANASGSVFRRSRLKRFRRFAGAALVFLGDTGGVCVLARSGLRRVTAGSLGARREARGHNRWNLKDRDPTDPTPAPSTPGRRRAHRDRGNRRNATGRNRVRPKRSPRMRARARRSARSAARDGAPPPPGSTRRPTRAAANPRRRSRRCWWAISPRTSRRRRFARFSRRRVRASTWETPRASSETRVAVFGPAREAEARQAPAPRLRGAGVLHAPRRWPPRRRCTRRNCTRRRANRGRPGPSRRPPTSAPRWTPRS